MTEKELKKLSRAELLELLLIQTKKVEQLEEKLAKADSLLSDRYMKFTEAGSLAEAMLKVNGVMEAAQAAANQYLENIKEHELVTKQHCQQMILDAKKEAEIIRSNPRTMTDEELDALINEKYLI